MDLNIGTALWFAGLGIGRIAEASDTREEQTLKQYRLYRTTSDSRRSEESSEEALDLVRNALLSEFSEPSSAPRTCKSLPISMFGSHPYSIPYKKYGFSKLIHLFKAAQKAGICILTIDRQKNYWVQPGIGVLVQNDSPRASRASSEELQSAQSRLVFTGSGADEALAGYRRHRAAYHSKYNLDKTSSERLFRELDADCARYFHRNAGRDDRVISDSGRELATPFLDEKVLDFVGSQEASALWDLCAPEGIGDKKIARTAARMAGLGVGNCASATTLIKRAIQFGSRIANRRIKGQERLEAV